MDHDQAGAVASREIEMRARNRRLGLILASIAAVFFFGVILKYTLLR
jgi:hypothetical protein